MTNPIIFGDYMKVGANKEDRMYEELSNIDRVKQVLGDVSIHNIKWKFELCTPIIWE